MLHSIQAEARKILTPDDIRNLGMIPYAHGAKEHYMQQAASLEKEIERRERYRKKTYQNYLDDVISKEEYVSYTREYEEELRSLKDELERLNERRNEENRAASESDEWSEKFLDYLNVDKLTREIVLELIERIEVNEDGSAHIFYKFKNLSADK